MFIRSFSNQSDDIAYALWFMECRKQRQKNTRLMRGLWKTGLWKTLPLIAGWIILSKTLRNFKGFCPVDNLMNLLEFIHLLRQGLVAVRFTATRFMVLDTITIRFFPVFRFL